MLTLRRSHERGRGDHGWLKSRFTFSFANYYDPRFMGFRSLRVINEDHIAPVSGFDTHHHEDMEILTWIVEGELTHQDSLGSRGILKENDAQAMSAGTGISHSERNESSFKTVHLIQIWIQPSTLGRRPVYAQKHFPLSDRLGRLQPIASPDARDGSLIIGQDTTVFVAHLRASDHLRLPLSPGRHLWIQSISATLNINGHTLEPGDSVAISDEDDIALHGSKIEGDILIFDLA